MRRAADPSRPSRATRRAARIRLGVLAVVAIAAVGTIATRGAGEASATAADEANFVEALNEVRAEVGLPAFTVNDELADLGRDHAAVMADAGEIFHANPISAGYTGEWAKIGENVGVGANVAVLVDAFVASPGHYANIVDPAFTEIGVGVVWRDNAMYTTHRFLQAPNAAPASPPAPVTTSTVAPTTTTAAAPAAPPPTPVELLPPPAISAERVEALLELLHAVGY